MITDQAFCAGIHIEYFDIEAEARTQCNERLAKTFAEMNAERQAYEDHEREASIKTMRMLIGSVICALCFWAALSSFVYWLVN